MSLAYEQAKQNWELTTPIRGKPHIKPLNDRRKKHETVELYNTDKQIYSYKLYDTHVIKFYPDGKVSVGVDNFHHHTQTTASFINKHGPVRCFRFDNRLWISCGTGYFPMPNAGELMLERRPSGNWQPVDKVYAQKKVIDRKVAKAVRDPYREFIKFGETILKVSDGWVMPETFAEFFTVDKYADYYGKPFITFRPTIGSGWIANALLDLVNAGEDEWMRVFLHMLYGMPTIDEERVLYEDRLALKRRYKPAAFVRHAYGLIDSTANVHTTKQVECTGSTMRGIVGA